MLLEKSVNSLKPKELVSRVDTPGAGLYLGGVALGKPDPGKAVLARPLVARRHLSRPPGRLK